MQPYGRLLSAAVLLGPRRPLRFKLGCADSVRRGLRLHLLDQPGRSRAGFRVRVKTDRAAGSVGTVNDEVAERQDVERVAFGADQVDDRAVGWPLEHVRPVAALPNDGAV